MSVSDATSFRFAYDPPTLQFGHEAVTHLADELEALDVEDAFVVTGETVGATDAVMSPLTTGLDDRLAGVFAGTTPEKRLTTALDARDQYHDLDADGIVAVGGGSSLDVAKVTAALIPDARDRDSILTEFGEHGTITIPDGDLPPVIVVPTTLAGADMSQVAGITATPDAVGRDTPKSGGVSDRRLMPAAAWYDPTLFATTPVSVLCGSAMNGFDKGLETVYARNATPITDATATHGLQFLVEHLPTLDPEGDVTPETLAPIVKGILLVQYGISRPTGTTLSIIHAFGHGLTAYGDLQQGIAHAVIAPHVLEYLFENGDLPVNQLATAFGVADVDHPERAVIDHVKRLRDGMGLPTRLRDVDAPDREQFEAVARATNNDAFMENRPPGIDPGVEDLVEILETAY